MNDDDTSALAHQQELENRRFEEEETQELWKAVKRGDLGAIQNLMLAHPSSGYQSWLDSSTKESQDNQKEDTCKP